MGAMQTQRFPLSKITDLSAMTRARFIAKNQPSKPKRKIKMEEEKDQMALRKTEMKEKGQSELIILEEKMKNMIRKKKICMKKTQLRNWIPK